MSKAERLAALESAEREYLADSGWKLLGGLWFDPRNVRNGHIQRVAAYKQRQRDTAEENARENARRARP